MTLPARTRLGTYEILDPLGAGGMGEVYRAKDLRLGREVAIKVLPSDVASNPDRLARFEHEARTVAGLNHPNIVTLFSVEDAGGVRFLTMELVEGQTLSTLVSPGGLPLPKLLELAMPLADALAAAHEKGVVHRDLKPGNVMVTREGRVKVLDFGLAKIADERGATEGTTLPNTVESPSSGETHVLGTVQYMAPEQLRGEPADARSDLFALGIMLYELATGRRPFVGDTSFAVASSILRDGYDPLTRVRPDVPADLEHIVDRCLEKNPRDRVQTALEVASELRSLRQMAERGAMGKAVSVNVASIAVLPFVNRSRDEEDEYFSDGLADELLNVLSKINGLRVSARASSFQFKGKSVPLAEVGKALNVATVLDGSVRKLGNRVRISVQLVKVPDGDQLWSERYDRTLEDIFAVQDDIAQSVVKELRTKLLGEEFDSKLGAAARADVAIAVRGRGESGEAYRLFLQGRYFVYRSTREDVQKGIEYLTQAIEIDPNLALAWAELSAAYAVQAGYGWVEIDPGVERARQAVQRALALEPNLAEGHVRLGAIQMNYDRDWNAAEASFRRALEAAPGNAVALRVAGNLASNLGRLEDAVALYEKAVEQDPLSPASYQGLAITYHAAGRLRDAEDAYRMALAIAPQRIGTRYGLGLVLLAQGHEEEALAEAEQEPEEVFRLWSCAVILHATGRRDESDKTLKEIVDKYSRGGAYQIAEVHAARGETDAAFEWLERAYEQHDGGLVEMKPEPMFRSLHGDARWGAFLKKMGLEG